MTRSKNLMHSNDHIKAENGVGEHPCTGNTGTGTPFYNGNSILHTFTVSGNRSGHIICTVS